MSKDETQSFDPSKYAGKGTDMIDPSELGMPFLKILQDLSPEIKKTHPRHEQAKIEGAEEGDIVFGPEKRLFKEGVEIIPLAVRTMYTEWRPRADGGGFIGYRNLDVAESAEYERDGSKEYLGENELYRTTYFCVLFKDGEEWKRGIISFTSTQLAKARQLNKMILSFRYEENKEVKPPIFACTYKLSSTPESNTQGSWHGWKIEQLGPIHDTGLLDTAAAACDEAVSTLPRPGSAPTAELPEGSAAAETEAF